MTIKEEEDSGATAGEAKEQAADGGSKKESSVGDVVVSELEMATVRPSSKQVEFDPDKDYNDESTAHDDTGASATGKTMSILKGSFLEKEEEKNTKAAAGEGNNKNSATMMMSVVSQLTASNATKTKEIQVDDDEEDDDDGIEIDEERLPRRSTYHKDATAAADADAAAAAKKEYSEATAAPLDAGHVIKSVISDWFMTVVIGFLVVSYWRGTWTLLDRWTCGMPDTASLVNGELFCFAVDFRDPIRIRSGVLTYWVSLVVIMAGVALVWMGLWMPFGTTDESMASTGDVSHWRAFVRFVIVYLLGFGTVLTWHGIWYIVDYFFIPNNFDQSFGLGTLIGMAGCYLLCAGGSLLAPPVIFLRDGPSDTPPPIAVTILSSYYSLTLPHDAKPPDVRDAYKFLDILVSFFVIPFFVVWYWRSFWQLQDLYFYGFGPDVQDVYTSLVYSTILALFCCVLGSDDIVYFCRVKNKIMQEIVGRLRTLILAVGVVSFWRIIWYVWDLFLGGTTGWSSWLSHWLGVGCLTWLGCLSCITAPPTTLGVDFIPHPDAAEEHLFSFIPIPAESIHVFGIARQPIKKKRTLKAAAASIIAMSKFSKAAAKHDDEEAGEARDSVGELAGSGFSVDAMKSIASSKTYHNLQRPNSNASRSLEMANSSLSSRNLMKRSNDLCFRSR